MAEVRKPNSKEKLQLMKYLVDRQGGEIEDIKLDVEGASIAVFDNYITDSPGYVGKVMVVVWSGAPEFYTAFVWRNGELEGIRTELQD